MRITRIATSLTGRTHHVHPIVKCIGNVMSKLTPTVTGEEIAAWLHKSFTYFRDHISKQPGFPKPIAPKVWRKSDIEDWADMQTKKAA